MLFAILHQDMKSVVVKTVCQVGIDFFFSNCGSFLSSLTLPFAAFKSGEGRKAKPAD